MCATPQGKTSARARTRTARTSVQARGVCGSASVSVLGRGMGEEEGGGLCHESVRLQEARVARVKLEGGVLVAFPFLADPLNGENGSVPIENLAGERANVPGCRALARPDSGPEHSALSTRRDGREGGLCRLSSLVSRPSSVVCRLCRLWAEKRWRINWGPRKSMASLFLSFFFLVAIGLASRNKERAGGDRRGEADECCDGMRECFLWRRGTCRSWASMACRLPPSRSRASSEASVLLFFLVEGGPWCGNVCGFRRDSACHLAPASVSCRADSRRRVALHEWDR